MIALTRETTEVRDEALTLPDEARALVCDTDQRFEEAGAFLVTCKRLREKIEETFGPIVSKAHAVHKEAVAQRKKVEAPVAEAERIIKASMSTYRRAQEQKRIAAEKKAREAAQKIADEEALQRAVELEQSGREAEAEKVIAEPVKPAPYISPAVAPTASGVAFRERWKFRIVDASAIKPEFMVPDMVKIGKIVRSMKRDADNMVGGIEAYDEGSVAAKS